MGLFGNKKETCSCGDKKAVKVKVKVADNTCCGETVNGICCIKVLGAGCKACHAQYEYVKTAVKNIGLNIEVEYITDMEKVVTYGVMAMPAIVVNEKVVSAGKVLKANDVEKLLHKFNV